VEFVVVLSICFFKILLADFLEIVQIVRTLGINALVYYEMLAVFLMNEAVRTVRAFKGKMFLKSVFIRTECSLTNLAQKLARITIVPIKEWLWSIAGWACAVLWYIAFGTTTDRLNRFAIPLFIVVVEIFPVPILVMVNDSRKLINLKLLIFG